MITLVLPPGAEDGPISHGTADFSWYRADITDPFSPRLVDVPNHVAEHLMHRGGFALYQHEMQRRLSGEMVRLYHPDGPRSISWDSVNYDPDEHGENLVPSEAVPDCVLSFGFRAAPERAEADEEEAAEAEDDAAVGKGKRRGHILNK